MGSGTHPRLGGGLRCSGPLGAGQACPHRLPHMQQHARERVLLSAGSASSAHSRYDPLRRLLRLLAKRSVGPRTRHLNMRRGSGQQMARASRWLGPADGSGQQMAAQFGTENAAQWLGRQNNTRRSRLVESWTSLCSTFQRALGQLAWQFRRGAPHAGGTATQRRRDLSGVRIRPKGPCGVCGFEPASAVVRAEAACCKGRL